MDILSAGLFRFADACGNNGVLPGLFKGLTCGGGEVRITSVSDVVKIVANAVQALILISGGLAVILILIAAVYYITSMGDPGRIKQAKEIIINTIIGLGVIIMAYAIVGLIARGL